MKLAGETFSGAIRRHADSATAHFQPVSAAMRPGQHLADLPIYGSSTYTLEAGTLYAGLMVAARGMEIERLNIYVASPAAEGAQARLGIYACNRDLYPSSLLLDAGTVGVDVPGTRGVEAEYRLERGYYFLCVVADGTPTCSYLRIGWSPLGIYNNFTGVFSGYYLSCSYGELPQQFPAGGINTNVSRLACVRARGWR